MQNVHALPAEWEAMTYSRFLEERRKMMAEVIQKGFETLLSGHTDWKHSTAEAGLAN
jgi:hypothetical protein